MKRERLDLVSVDTALNGKHPGNGRFLAGNCLASRRNSRRAWQQSFDSAFTPEDMRAVVRKAVAQAKAGDRFAREWLGQYALQRPPRLIDLALSEGSEPATLESDPEAFEYS